MADPLVEAYNKIYAEDPLVDTYKKLYPEDPLVSAYNQLYPEDSSNADTDQPGLVGRAARTVVRPILAGLGYLQRPSAALWEGVSQAIDEDPETTFMQGAWKGLTGKAHTQLSDVLGLPQTSAEDTWPTYLLKGGARFAVDLAGDPLTYLGPGLIRKVGIEGVIGGGSKALAKALGYERELEKLAGVPGKVSKKIAGSPVGKWFYHEAPAGNEAFDRMTQTIATESNIVLENTVRALNQVQNLRKQYKAAGQEWGDDVIREALEHPKSPQAKQVPKDLLDAYDDLRRISLEQFGEENASRFAVQLAHKKAVEETSAVHYIPRIEKSGHGLHEMSYAPEMGQGVPRKGSPIELVRWVDDLEYAGGKGRLVDPDEMGPIITKASEGTRGAAKAGIKFDPQGEYFYYQNIWGEKIPVVGVRPSLMDIYDASKRRGSDFAERYLTNPELSLAGDIAAKRNRINFYNFAKWVSQNGDGTKSWAKLAHYDLGGKLVEEPGYRALKISIPGLENQVFEKWVANRLENMFQLMVDPASATDVLTKFSKQFFNTKFGQYLKAYTQVWKRNQLALFPGFHVANAASNQTLIYLAGVRDPKLFKDAVEVLFAGDGSSIIQGLSNAEVKQMLRRTGLYQTGMTEAGMEGGQDLIAQLGRATKFRFTEAGSKKLQKIGVPEKYAEVFPEVAKNWEWLNDKGFWVGQQIENHGKTVIALDYLKKAVRQGRPINQELFNEASMRAKKFMFDYGLLTPFEQQLKNVFPFLSWYRNIIGLTLKQLGSATGISNLDKVGRIWDFTFTPLAPEDQNIAPPYITGAAKGMPLFDWLRAGLGYPNKGDEVFETSRFNALGSLQQFLDRPKEGLLSNLGPIPRFLLEVPQGKSYFLDRPVDRTAGGIAMGLINPLIGGPYEKSYHKTLGFDAPAALDYLLTSYTPFSRHLSTDETLLANWLYEDPSRKPMGPAAKTMWLLTGGKVQDFDRPRWRKRRAGEFQDELNYLKRVLRDAAQKGDTRRVEHYRKLLQQAARKNPFAID